MWMKNHILILQGVTCRNWIKKNSSIPTQVDPHKSHFYSKPKFSREL